MLVTRQIDRISLIVFEDSRWGVLGLRSSGGPVRLNSVETQMQFHHAKNP